MKTISAILLILTALPAFAENPVLKEALKDPVIIEELDNGIKLYEYNQHPNRYTEAEVFLTDILEEGIVVDGIEDQLKEILNLKTTWYNARMKKYAAEVFALVHRGTGDEEAAQLLVSLLNEELQSSGIPGDPRSDVKYEIFIGGLVGLQVIGNSGTQVIDALVNVWNFGAIYEIAVDSLITLAPGASDEDLQKIKDFTCEPDNNDVYKIKELEMVFVERLGGC